MWPAACPGVDSPLLNPRELWSDREAYDKSHKNLAEKFKSNFEQFRGLVQPEVAIAGP